jgi:hypothetical protein
VVKEPPAGARGKNPGCVAATRRFPVKIVADTSRVARSNLIEQILGSALGGGLAGSLPGSVTSHRQRRFDPCTSPYLVI